MEVLEITAKEYYSYFQAPYHIFNSSKFNEINESKCEGVYYLAFKDTKVRLGIIVGKRQDYICSPFSAPFGGFNYIKEDVRLQSIDIAIAALIDWITKKNFKSIQITLPPTIYNESFIAKQHNCFTRANFVIKRTDLNYSFNLKLFTNDYQNILWRNARKNLKNAQKNDFEFRECLTIDEKELAYNVIKQNREERGFPLRMEWSQILETLEVINADFFIASKESIAIAAAMVFHVAPSIVQVVYWGDLPKYSNLKTMNFLSYKVFEFYKNSTVKIIDIGPSTENSIPNFGLCEFKESIGCNITTKLSFEKLV